MKFKFFIHFWILWLVACSSPPKGEESFPHPTPSPAPVVSTSDTEVDEENPTPPPPVNDDNNKKYDISALSLSEVQELDVKELSPQQISQILPMHIPFLAGWQVNSFTPEQIQAFTPEQMQAFTPKQIGYKTTQAFTPEQISHLTVRQIREDASFFKEDLTDNQLKLLNAKQIKAVGYGFFTSERLLLLIDKLNPEELADFIYYDKDDLTAKDVALIPGEHLKVLRQRFSVTVPGLELENIDITKIKPNQIPELNMYYIKVFPREYIKALTPEQIQAFTPEQLSAFTLEHWDVFNDMFNEEQIQALTKEQIQSQNMETDFKFAVSRFSVEQMGFLTKEQIQQLAKDRAGGLHFANSNFRGIKPEYVKEIDPRVIKELYRICQYRYLTAEEVAELKKHYTSTNTSEYLIKEWTRPDNSAHTTAEQMKHFTPEQIVMLDISQCSQGNIYALTEEQIPFLTAQQIRRFFAGSIRKMEFSPHQMQFITVSQIRWFYPMEFEKLSAEHIQNIKPEVFGQMRTNSFNTRVTDGKIEKVDIHIPQIDSFKPEQVAFFTIAQIQNLSLDQVTALREDQVQAFTPEQAKAFSEKQILVLSEEAKNILNSKRNL